MVWTTIWINEIRSIRGCGLVAGLVLHALTLPAYAAMTLDEVVRKAQENDPWLVGSVHRQQALQAQSTAQSTMPDPMLSVGLANLPTDTFDFDQEAMTQFKVGVTQTIPRGDSLQLRQQQLATLGNQQSLMREDRKAKVAVGVSHLWLDSWRAAETIRLIEDDRELFEHLVDVAQSSYSSAVGRTRQQDLVRAQLELTRLEDRLTSLHERLEISQSQLSEWLLPGGAGAYDQWRYARPDSLELPPGQPVLDLAQPELFRKDYRPDAQEIATHLISHPAILNLDTKIAASATGVQIAEQKYKPEWKVNASYGYRDDAQDGMERSDFFSVGLAFDLPLFTSKRQDQQVQSAVSTTEAIRTERALLLRSMVAAFDTQRARLLRLDERRTLYQTRLLAEMHDQAEASLTAYTNDDGDFAEVVRSRIAELNARIDALNIEIDRLKTIAQLNYFFTTNTVPSTGEQV
jgi:outer membrane protein TolC